MKTPEQWLESDILLGIPAEFNLKLIRFAQAIQKDAVACTQSDHNKALSQLRSFLHNQLHKVNFGHKP